MSGYVPEPPSEVDPGDVKADPRKPYKAILAFVGLVLGLLWANLEGRDTLSNMTTMEWLSIVIPVVLTTCAVYGVENPKVIRPKGR